MAECDWLIRSEKGALHQLFREEILLVIMRRTASELTKLLGFAFHASI
jgi:hypothetical protein